MTKLLDQALEAIRRMRPETQDAIAEMLLAVTDPDDAVEDIPAEHRTAVLQGLAQAEQGAFATDDEVAAAFRRFQR